MADVRCLNKAIDVRCLSPDITLVTRLWLKCGACLRYPGRAAAAPMSRSHAARISDDYDPSVRSERRSPHGTPFMFPSPSPTISRRRNRMTARRGPPASHPQPTKRFSLCVLRCDFFRLDRARPASTAPNPLSGNTANPILPNNKSGTHPTGKLTKQSADRR